MTAKNEGVSSDFHDEASISALSRNGFPLGFGESGHDSMGTDEIRSFLDTVCGLVKAGRNDEAADLSYDQFHALLVQRDAPACDELFRQATACISKLGSSLQRSFLSVSFRDKNSLAYRRVFFDRAYDEVARLQGAERAERLLGHLR